MLRFRKPRSLETVVGCTSIKDVFGEGGVLAERIVVPMFDEAPGAPATDVASAAGPGKARWGGQAPSQFVAHLLFHGPPGTGKTTCAQILARRFAGLPEGCPLVNSVASPVRQVDCSKETGTANLEEMRRTGIFSQAPLKVDGCALHRAGLSRVVILDEFDGMVKPAQLAIQRLIQSRSTTCLFITIANELHMVPEEVRSHCVMFEFTQCTRADKIKLVRALFAAQAGETVPESVVERLADLSQDFRVCDQHVHTVCAVHSLLRVGSGEEDGVRGERGSDGGRGGSDGGRGGSEGGGGGEGEGDVGEGSEEEGGLSWEECLSVVCGRGAVGGELAIRLLSAMWKECAEQAREVGLCTAVDDDAWARLSDVEGSAMRIFGDSGSARSESVEDVIADMDARGIKGEHALAQVRAQLKGLADFGSFLQPEPLAARFVKCLAEALLIAHRRASHSNGSVSLTELSAVTAATVGTYFAAEVLRESGVVEALL